MSDLILGIDIGTTAVKTAVFDYEGQLISTATVEYSLITPQNNFVEAPCDVYMDSIRQGLEYIRTKGDVDTRNIKLVGFSAQGETLFFLDENGRPLRNAIVWMDNRATRQAEKLKERFGNELCYRITGQVSFEPCWPAAKILWVKENEKDVFEQVKHILLIEDYIIYLMTGQYVAEGSLLCSTLYWDITTKKYWQDMLDFIGISDELLPKIMESGQLVGTVTPKMAEYLKISPDAKISTGCLDQVAGAIGVGNIRPGIFSENIGAALAVCAPTANLTYDPNRLMPVHYFAVPDTYMMHTFTTGGMALKWFRDSFAQQELDMEAATGLDSYFLLDRIAAGAPPGCDGLLTLPHLSGSMAPDVNLSAKGVFYGFTLKHKKAHFIRSIMESLGYIICRNIEALDQMGLHVDQIRSLGGGSKSDLWNQIKADITGKKLFIMQSSREVACLGAAILAGLASGIFTNLEEACDSMVKTKKVYEPNLDNHRLYQEQYSKYKKLFNDMSGMFEVDAK